MSKETALQYFSRKSGFMMWLVGLIGLCMVYVGYSGERRSVIFMAVGVVLVILCAYELIRSRTRMRKGTELDEVAEAAVKKRNLFTCAAKQLCISVGDVAEDEQIALIGYCAFAIQTRPYYRRDETDGKLRSSNYQTSLLIFCPDRFYTYSYVISLVDKESSESGRMWRYDQVSEARIVRDELNYPIGTGDEKRETSTIEYLSLQDSEGSRLSFFFDRSPDGEKRVARVLEILAERAGVAPEPPKQKDAQTAQADTADAPRITSAARGRDLDIGVIGDRLSAPKK